MNQPIVLVAPSARDLTRDYMIEQLEPRGITAPWSTGIPADRPARFFSIEDLNSATEFGVFADAQLLQIRCYDQDLKWLGETMRLVKGLWAVMPGWRITTQNTNQSAVQNVEHAGGPTYDMDPDAPGLHYGQVIAWVTVLTFQI